MLPVRATRLGWALLRRGAVLVLAGQCCGAWLGPVSALIAGPPIQLRDVTQQTGIAFRHTDGGSGRRYIVETVTAGLALFDYDGDGDVDIYFLNGAPLRGTPNPVGGAQTPPKNALYRNDGGFHFTDVTDRAGVGDTGFGLGVAVADYDNDGDLDVYLNNFGPNVLYRNNGDRTFTDVTQPAGVGDGHQVGAGTNFLDVDRDGDLDLYVSHYVPFTYDRQVPRLMKGFHTYPSPKYFAPTPDALYRNNGDGTFTDVSRESGIGGCPGRAMGTVCADYDDDGDTDIVTANDEGANFLFLNDGTGKFEETGLVAGIAYDLNGRDQGSMGVVCGDYNHDGRLDILVTSYQDEPATLYKNLGGGFFQDVTFTTGAGAGTLAKVTWGTGLVDFDNDGDRDLFLACGHLLDNVERFDDTSTYFQKNVLLMNTGGGKFINVSDQCGDGLNVQLSSRGAAFDDLDNDGDVDVVVLNSRRQPTILRNDSPGGNHWIDIRLRGTNTNRDGVGARVTVVAGGLTQIDEVHSGRSYQSDYGKRLHFGLGKRDRIDRIEVRWIGGGVDVLQNIRPDRLLTITEGSAATPARPLPRKQPNTTRRPGVSNRKRPAGP